MNRDNLFFLIIGFLIAVAIAASLLALLTMRDQAKQISQSQANIQYIANYLNDQLKQPAAKK